MTELTGRETDFDLQVFPFPGAYGVDVVIDFPGRSPDNPVPAVRLAPGGELVDAMLKIAYQGAVQPATRAASGRVGSGRLRWKAGTSMAGLDELSVTW
jgi:hypothetical protein